MKKILLLSMLLSSWTLFAGSNPNPWEAQNAVDRQPHIEKMHSQMTNDPFLSLFLKNPEAPIKISTGVELPQPFGFDDGSGVTLFGYADYEKTKEKLKPEGITPLPYEDPASHKIFALVYIDVTAYSKTSMGPAYVARTFIHATISQSATDKLKALVDPEFTRTIQYPSVLMTWRYWEGGSLDARVGGREALKWPQDPARMEIDYTGAVKTAKVVSLSGQPILSFKFDGTTRLKGVTRTAANGLIIAITPENTKFNSSQAGAYYNVIPTQGVAYDSFFPFDKTKDSFKAHGQLKADLDSIGFNAETALWQVKPYYKGVFIANPPAVSTIGK